MKILFSAQVCWQDREEYAPYQPTCLTMIVFERGDGPEVIRTSFTNWQERVEKGEARVAKVPSKYLENLQQLVYARKELQPLIG